MGDVLDLAQARQRRRARPLACARPTRPPVTCFFDLGSPWTYLAAERIDRLIGDVEWRPAVSPIAGVETRRVRAGVTDRARTLHLPLIWPERAARSPQPAMRIAALAAERRQGAAFVLAASRLAFCGGFDLDDLETLAEAAAAARLPLSDCLTAAGERWRDDAMAADSLFLMAQGVVELPLLFVGHRHFCGERQVEAAAAAARASWRPSPDAVITRG